MKTIFTKLCPPWSLLLFFLPLTAFAQAHESFTWSSTACPKCQNTIVYQAWFPDGSPLVAEGMSGANTGALVAISRSNDTLVLSLGLSISRDPSLILDVRRSITIETDSAPNMILYPMQEPGRGFHKDDIAVLRGLNPRSIRLLPHVTASGFLFFPADRNASHFVVVVRAGGEILRFPFVPDPTAPGKFIDPAKAAPALSAQAAAPAHSHACAKNVSFAIAEDGTIAARPPEFTAKWVEKNSARYPSLCFSQTPDSRIANYLVVFAPSESLFGEVYPSLNKPGANSAPADGQGSSAAAWTYNYFGAGSSTTTTTKYISLPVGDKTRTFYAYTYDQTGRIVSRRQRTVETRRNNGSLSNLGMNVAAAIAATHLKERLLEDAANDLTR